MPSSRSVRWLAAAALPVVILVAIAGVSRARRAPDPPRRLGPQRGGETLLPNGWTLAPAGRHLAIGDLPLAMVLSRDGRRLIVTNNGWAKPSLTIVDVERAVVTQRQMLDHAWLGLAWHPDGSRLYSSGAAQNSVVELQYADGVVSKPTVIPLGGPSEQPRSGTNRPAPIDPDTQLFVGGIAVTADGFQPFSSTPCGAIRSIPASTLFPSVMFGLAGVRTSRPPSGIHPRLLNEFVPSFPISVSVPRAAAGG